MAGSALKTRAHRTDPGDTRWAGVDVLIAAVMLQIRGSEKPSSAHDGGTAQKLPYPYGADIAAKRMILAMQLNR